MSEDEPQPNRPKSPNRLNRKKLPKRAQNYSRKQLLEAMKRKKECDSKALVVVETCLDSIDTPEELLHMLREINQSHYQDVTEERAITRLCGYPLCKNELTTVPKKQYHISTATNKVYDITERKNFCSSTCFKASNYLKSQLLTSPLWLRDVEDIPEFKLLALE